MLACRIPDVKDFMSKVFMQDTFDRFELVEASITTFNTFLIDGKMQREFYTEEEWEELENPAYSFWKRLRPVCFSLIKGKKTPQSLKFVFRVPKELMQEILEDEGLKEQEENVAGMFLNIRYEKNQVSVFTGISMKTFCMDKSIEHAWEKWFRRFLREKEIDAEEL